MKTSTQNAPPVVSTDLFASLAAEWESRPERVADVAEQIREIHDKLIEWGWGEVDREELDHATIAYSRACGSYECCEWLPFAVMPDWETDLYCILMDRERWEKYRHVERCTSKLAARIRRANAIGEARAESATPPHQKGN